MADESPRANCCLFIDDREKGIVEAFGEASRSGAIIVPPHTIFVDKLTIGDYAIATRISPDSDLLGVRMVFERKTFKDLLDSIGGTRWKNQLSKLLKYLQENPDTIVVYIIESDESDTSFYMDIADALIDLNIHVVYTKSTFETIRYLMKRVKTLSHSDSLPQLVSRQIAQYKEFQGKKYDINPDNFLLETLKIVPKITPQCAAEIAKNYDSLADFITRCTPNTLIGTVYRTEKNKEAHIGETRARNIVALFWNVNETDRAPLQRLTNKYRAEKEALLHPPPPPSKKHKSKRSKHE
jgi:ERCC4-type nuclease